MCEYRCTQVNHYRLSMAFVIAKAKANYFFSLVESHGLLYNDRNADVMVELMTEKEMFAALGLPWKGLYK